MLDPGEPAPEITAVNQYGEDITPTFEEPTVVYFYPKDFTGGCTIEANDFQDALPQYREAGIAVYGVSMDDVESHAEFADEEGILFDLLADPDGAIAEAFGLDTAEGHTDRRTFVLAEGKVFAVYNPELSDPAGHALEVLNDTRNEFITGG
jgi:peroxiredoxin Q/BCP